MIANPRQKLKRRSFVGSCLVPIAGVLIFIVVCYGLCQVVFLIGNPNPNSTSGLHILLSLLS